MRDVTCAVLFVLIASLVPAQSFECQPLGPLPGACCGDCEDVWSNNLGVETGVRTLAACGMPAAGGQYARATASGAHPLGPGIPRPIPGNVTEIKVLVPDGADGVTFKWNWFDGESVPSEGAPIVIDGLEIAIVAPDNVTVLVPCVYVDSLAATAPGGCNDPVTGGADILNDGVETFSVAFAPVPFGSYLSIVSFNGGDTQFPSSGVIDCIAWGNPGTPSYELGDLLGPRITDLNPATSFRIGVPMSVRVQAGVPFVEGFHCFVMQKADFSTLPQFIVPGIAGGLYVRLNRPTTILSEGLLAGGILAGTAGNGPIVNFTINDPALCGVGLVLQAYVITEDATNPTFTTALFGWLR
jgi:hypothetical protein